MLHSGEYKTELIKCITKTGFLHAISVATNVCNNHREVAIYVLQELQPSLYHIAQ